MEYYKTKESVNEYIELAKDVNGQKLINELQKVLEENSLLLEIGSGPGTDWKLLSKHNKVIGSDFSSEFISHLKNKFPEGEFLELDATTLKTTREFDGIYANKVLHHLTDDELTQSITRQAEILKKDGVVCLSFWKGEGSETFKGMFVNYHTESELKEFFEPYFEILSIAAYEEFEAGDSLLLIAKKK